ncbi:hypothetical protein FACS1894181_01850 [Bacteroidia bacterium]|nr:hypothetical protein FACS1894181_01850 [Bacteroidia bacterium]
MLLTCLANLPAQVVPNSAPAVTQQTIFDEIQRQSPGKGKAIIDQPAAIRNLVGSPVSGNIETSSDGKSYIRYQGFRVQVFSGNDHRTSKDEAFKREAEIKELMPGLSTDVSFEAPFWRVRVGDFSTREDAYDAQRQLMQLLPNYRKEMYIVREDIKILLNEGA